MSSTKTSCWHWRLYNHHGLVIINVQCHFAYSSSNGTWIFYFYTSSPSYENRKLGVCLWAIWKHFIGIHHRWLYSKCTLELQCNVSNSVNLYSNQISRFIGTKMGYDCCQHSICHRMAAVVLCERCLDDTRRNHTHGAGNRSNGIAGHYLHRRDLVRHWYQFYDSTENWRFLNISTQKYIWKHLPTNHPRFDNSLTTNLLSECSKIAISRARHNRSQIEMFLASNVPPEFNFLFISTTPLQWAIVSWDFDCLHKC